MTLSKRLSNADSSRNTDPEAMPWALRTQQNKNYFAALLADDVKVRNCTNPTPKPPAAPASSPSITSKGTFSRIDFFTDFAIHYLREIPIDISCHNNLSICASICTLTEVP
jgi:hypothetical protein